MKKLITSIFLLVITISAIAQNKSESLYDAVSKNDKAQVEKLIKKGADVNFIKEMGPWMKVSPLIAAVLNKNLDIIKTLIANKADINWKDGFNTSAIMYAANSGEMEIVKLLLENGANINDSDGQGNTVLSSATKSKNTELIVFVEETIKDTK